MDINKIDNFDDVISILPALSSIIQIYEHVIRNEGLFRDMEWRVNSSKKETMLISVMNP